MRPIGLVLLLLCACGEPGLRDRSLMARVESGAEEATPPVEVSLPTPARPSYVGLVPDSLSNYYAEDAEVIVRFADLATLRRAPARQLAAIRAAYPELGLPGLDPVHLVRHMLGLPNSVAINIVRPFAFVKVADGWVGVLASRSFAEAGERMKALDAIYVVAGDPKLVAGYEAGFRKGHYLPGDCSLRVRPESIPELGSKLTGITHLLGLDLEFLDGWCRTAPSDLERLDVAAHFGDSGVRLDVRAAPEPDSPTALYLRQLKPAAGTTPLRLPAGGAIYLEFVTAPRLWLDLVGRLRPDLLGGDAAADPVRTLWREALGQFGEDTSTVVQLDGEGGGSVVLAGHLEDATHTRVFLESQDMRRLLKSIAGTEGFLEFRPEPGSDVGPAIGTISGSISHRRLLGWRSSGDPVLASLSLLLQGPLLCRIAIVEDRIFMVMGKRARQGNNAFFRDLETGRKVDHAHAREAGKLFPHRIAAFTLDLGRLYDGALEAAPFWSPKGRRLREHPLDRRLPTTVAMTVEGGALRFAVRLRAVELAESARRVARLLK